MLVLIVYAIKENILLLQEFKIALPCSVIEIELNKHMVYSGYILLSIIISGVCLWMSRFLSDDQLLEGVINVELANNSYLPTYLGYFFVALGIEDRSTLFWVYFIIFVFSFGSQILYFNPLFLIFGYKFYYISVENGMKLFIITKRNIKSDKELSFENLKRINNYTFIERKIK